MSKKITQTALSAVVGAAVALALLPLSLSLTFHLNDFLARAVLSIEYVDATANTGSVRLPFNLIQEFSQSAGFQAHLMQISQAGQLNRFLISRPEFPSEDLDELKGLVGKYINDFKRRAIVLAFLLDELRGSEAVGKLEGVQAKYQASLGAMATFIMSASDQRLAKQELQSKIQTDLNRTQEAAQIAVQLLQVLGSLAVSNRNVQLKISILNRGNTDGLVRYIGSISIEGDSLSFPIRRIDPPKKSSADATGTSVSVFVTNPQDSVKEGAVGKVEKNSMAEYWFSVDRDALGADQIDRLDAIINSLKSKRIIVQLADHERRPLKYIANAD